jgi:hypothetical protein
MGDKERFFMTATQIAFYPSNSASGMSLIQKQVAVGTVGSLNFSGIPQTFSHLMLIIAGPSSGQDNVVYLTVNGDSGSNYSFSYLSGNGSAATSGNSAGSSTAIPVAVLTNGTGAGSAQVMLPNYATATPQSITASLAQITPSVGFLGQVTSGLWATGTPAAITSIQLSCSSFAAGAIASLYGLS